MIKDDVVGIIQKVNSKHVVKEGVKWGIEDDDDANDDDDDHDDRDGGIWINQTSEQRGMVRRGGENVGINDRARCCQGTKDSPKYFRTPGRK